MRFVCCILLSFLSIPALGDDSPLKLASGGVKLYDDKETNVSLDSQTVKIELGRTTFTIDATLEFLNHGETVTLIVGFPKYGFGWVSEDFKGVENFVRFETWVSGEQSDFREVQGEFKKEDVGGGWLEETRWYIKEVVFKGHEKTTTRVEYLPHITTIFCQARLV